MELKIYNQSDVLKLTLNSDSSSTHTQELNGADNLTITATAFSCVKLDVNDYVIIDNVRYCIKSPYVPEKKSDSEYEYRVNFYAPIHDAEQVIFFNLTDGQYNSEFSLDGNPREHLQKWVDNMNRLYSTDKWTIGTVVVAANKTIDYNNINCWDAAFCDSGIAKTFETEMWADGYTINLCKCERGDMVELGYLNGLTSLTQDENDSSVKFFTRLIPLGSTKNIDSSTYGFSRLQLPSRVKWVDRNTEYGIYEYTEEDAFADIFPHYIGTVTSVRSEEKTGENGTYTVYYFKDSSLPFSPADYEIAGLVKQLSFTSGDLNGREFEANWHADTSEWEIINIYPDDDTQIPGGNLIPCAGDKYFPWNIKMPQSYITAAENDYKAAVDDLLAKYSDGKQRYTGTTDYIDITKRGINLRIGQLVKLSSSEYFTDGYVNIRIVKVVRKLDELNDATITLSQQAEGNWASSVDNNINDLKYIIAQKSEQLAIDIIKSYDTKEASNLNVFSALRSLAEFVSKKKDNSVAGIITFLKGVLFGQNGHGITDVDGKFEAVIDLIKSINYTSGDLGTGFIIKKDKDGHSYIEVDELFVRKIAYFVSLVIKELKYVGGEIILSPASMKCSKVEDKGGYYRCYMLADDGTRTIRQEFVAGDQARRQTFNVTAGTSYNVSNEYYWRLVVGTGDDYIDLSKTDCDSGSTVPQPGDEIVQLGNRTDSTRQNAIILSTIGNNAPSKKNYVGINSYSLDGCEAIAEEIIDGRAILKILGDFFVGGTDSYIKFNSSTRKLEIKADDILFTSGEKITDWADGLNDKMDEVKKQADKEYTIWFYDYNPTTSNAPASGWSTDSMKALHEYDMFYNTDAGTAWRYESSDGIYGWVEITDAETIKALEKASSAEDKADNAITIGTGAQESADNAQGSADNAQGTANDAHTAAQNAYNLASSANSNADSAWYKAYYAQQDVNGMVATDFWKAKDKIVSIAGYYNADGTAKVQSGTVIGVDFSSMFSTFVDDQGIAHTATIEAYVDGKVAGISLKADIIDLQGQVTANGYFSIDQHGTMSCSHATISYADFEYCTFDFVKVGSGTTHTYVSNNGLSTYSSNGTGNLTTDSVALNASNGNYAILSSSGLSMKIGSVYVMLDEDGLSLKNGSTYKRYGF